MRRVAFTLGLSVALLLVGVCHRGGACARYPDVQYHVFRQRIVRLVHRQLDRIRNHPRTIFFDSSGHPRFRFLKGLDVEIDVNSVTGKIVLVHTAVTERFDFRTGFTTYTGQIDMGVGPGQHTSFIHDTGLLIFDADANIIRTAGQHTVLFGGDEPRTAERSS